MSNKYCTAATAFTKNLEKKIIFYCSIAFHPTTTQHCKKFNENLSRHLWGTEKMKEQETKKLLP